MLVILLTGGTKQRQQRDIEAAKTRWTDYRRRGLQAATATRKIMVADLALTKSFEQLVQRRWACDAAFAESLLREGIGTMLTGDVETGKANLRDYIKATVGFEKLSEATDAGQKPDPHVRPARQSASAQSLRRHRLPAKAGGY